MICNSGLVGIDLIFSSESCWYKFCSITLSFEVVR